MTIDYTINNHDLLSRAPSSKLHVLEFLPRPVIKLGVCPRATTVEFAILCHGWELPSTFVAILRFGLRIGFKPTPKARTVSDRIGP